jgi:hypothetical protein
METGRKFSTAVDKTRPTAVDLSAIPDAGAEWAAGFRNNICTSKYSKLMMYLGGSFLEFGGAACPAA